MTSLSNGLFVCWFEDKVGIELGHLTSEPKSISDFSKSKLHALGEAIEWDIKDEEPAWLRLVTRSRLILPLVEQP